MNGAYVAGWAWDREHPTAPLAVEIYDGHIRLATVLADRFRRDLRNADKGNGRHGFVYSFTAHFRDRRPHQITVRIAGTGVMLRDTSTGAAPRPVTRRDRPPAPIIAHFSLPPYARWFYYTFLKRLLSVFPRPTWRMPAIGLASIRALTDAGGRHLDVALLDALGIRTTALTRWQAHWMRCYLRQADLLLSIQSDRWTQAWIERHLPREGRLPPGGAVLIAPHHALQALSTIALCGMVARLGTISTAPPDPESLPDIDPTQLLHWRHLAIGRSRVLPYEIIHPRHAARQGLKLLRDGGYLVIIADAAEHAPPESLLGHAWAIPSGPIWFAQRSGKPIVPFTVMPYGLGWRLWLGQPIEPTRAGMRNGLEACLRRSPFGWERRIAMQWFEAKGQGASGRGDGPSHTPRPGITGETPDQDVGAARSPVLRGP